jgi:hypothetical protein
MVQRLDAISPRLKKDGNTFWIRVGTAWRSKDGVGYDVTFDAIPLPDKDGRCFVALREPKDGAKQPASTPSPLDELDDEIPDF